MIENRTRVLIVGFAIATLLGTGCSTASRSQQSSQSNIQPISESPSPEASPKVPQRGTPYPRRPFKLVDDAVKYPDFYQFRERLRKAIKQRDAKFIRAIATKDIRLTLGRNPRTLDTERIDDPKAEIWQNLERTFALGCRTQDKGKYWICPSVFWDWKNQLESWKYSVIVQNKVPVHTQANSKSKVIGFLSKEIVKLDHETDGSPFLPGWIRIVQPDGQIGYVEEQFIYSPIGYRAALVKEDRNWKMPFYVGGD